jgi:type II secretory ATPase GspE/PulE/Tfp pilus assembly ATPase PilB-like protein
VVIKNIYQTEPQKIDSVVTFIDDLVRRGYIQHASDIHIDPFETHVGVRMRIDGILQSVTDISKSTHAEIISRIKVLAHMRSDEHAMPQDGKFRYAFEDKKIDIRVSIAPTYYGENAVLRLLRISHDGYTFASLGFSKQQEEILENSLSRSHGMILSTGPTGSGKTTTLYAMLQHLESPEKSIITIEDPVEYAVSNIRHMQINPRTGFTFSTGLRAILRQDPNIIMVGEIRDKETAEIAIHAALTGHLLLTTLHTNDAATALIRLSDMGIDPYLIASTVHLSIGQRLVRKICESCKKLKALSISSRTLFSKLFERAPPECLLYGAGCDECHASGFKGRVVISEMLSLNDDIQKILTKNMSHQHILGLARSQGMKTMTEDAYEKVITGLTTFEEVLKVLHGNH